MRSVERLGLMWEDIDFDEMTITINHNLTRRTIGMSEVLASIFKEQKAYIDRMSASLGKKFEHLEMIFPSANGNYRDRSSVLTSLKLFTKGTEFKHMTLHKLRHCNATMFEYGRKSQNHQ